MSGATRPRKRILNNNERMKAEKMSAKASARETLEQSAQNPRA